MPDESIGSAQGEPGEGLEYIVQFLEDLQDAEDPLKGANLVGYKNRTVFNKLDDWLSPRDFGAVSSLTPHDDTAAIHACVTACLAERKAMRWDGDFGTTSKVTLAGVNGLRVIGCGTLTGYADSTQSAVLEFKNFADLDVFGAIVVSAGYRPNYDSAIAIYSDNGVGASQASLYGLHTHGAKLSWAIGRTSEPDMLISELVITGSRSYGCPSILRAVGTQTVIGLRDCQLISGVNGGDAAWSLLDRIVIQSIGANVDVHGGEALITDVITGLLTDVQPVGNSTINNSYGRVVFHGTTIESASTFASIRNVSSPVITDLREGAGGVEFINCNGFHSHDSFPLITSYDDFTGVIKVLNNNIDCNIVRTALTVSVGAANCDIYTTDRNMGKNFPGGLAGIAGGRLHFSNRDVVQLANLGGQTLTAATQTILRFVSSQITGDFSRIGPSYNTATGKLVLGKEGLKDATIHIKLRTASPYTANINFAIFVNDVFLTGSPEIKGDGVTGIIMTTLHVGNLAGGSVLDIRATASTTVVTTGGSALDVLTLNGRA
ncbi:hypothetical protein [Phytopseudomonas dryadis]|uniref:hypothetical protein n=1 Tax=Phytopseudomonas dryadis TaxID=2487520 RepID=UPI0010383D9B|nr:hypothetical protein [Pseudomonas dryadis]